MHASIRVRAVPSPSDFLQYGALGVVVLMLMLGAWFGKALMSILERAIDKFDATLVRVDTNVDQTRHHLSNALMGVEERLRRTIEDDRPTQPDAGRRH